VLHQTLNPAVELWCKTLSQIMFGVKLGFKPNLSSVLVM